MLFSLALCRFSLNCMFWDSFHTLACRGPLCLIYWPERCDFLVVSVIGASLEAGPRKGGGSKITKLGFPSYSSAPGDPFISLLPERQGFSAFFLFLLLATDPLWAYSIPGEKIGKQASACCWLLLPLSFHSPTRSLCFCFPLPQPPVLRWLLLFTLSRVVSCSLVDPLALVSAQHLHLALGHILLMSCVVFPCAEVQYYSLFILVSSLLVDV